MAASSFLGKTYLDVEDELKHSEQAHFSPEAMVIAISNKEARRAAKGKKLNCFVLDREATTEDELESFLEFLKSEQSNIRDGTRFQFVYRTKTSRGYHWSTADVRLKDGKFDFYLIDAANSLPSVLLATHAIHRRFPASTIKYSGLAIQTDGHNCASFALDHAYRLAKIDNLHDELKVFRGPFAGRYKTFTEFLANTAEVKNSGGTTRSEEIKAAARRGRPTTAHEMKDAVASLQMVSPLDFPKHFGPLLRNAQDFDLINFDNEDMTESWRNKLNEFKGSDTTNLKEYINARTRFPKFNPYSAPESREPPKRAAILRKRSNIKNKALDYLRGKDKKAIFAHNKNYRGRLLTHDLSASPLYSGSSVVGGTEGKKDEIKVASGTGFSSAAKFIDLTTGVLLSKEEKIKTKNEKLNLVRTRDELKHELNSYTTQDAKDKSLLITVLMAYKTSRKNEVDSRNQTRQYLSIFGGISENNKCNAVDALLNMLNRNENTTFNVNDIDAFNNGLLKEIIRKFKPALKAATTFDFQNPGDRREKTFTARIIGSTPIKWAV